MSGLLAFWADRLTALSPAQFTLLGALLMVAAGLTVTLFRLTELGETTDDAQRNN